MLKTIFLVAIATFGILILPLHAQERLPIIEVLTSDADARFGLFLAALDAAGLTDEVGALQNATVLAPTDQALISAMNYLGISQQSLFADSTTLAEILRLHVLQEQLFFRDLSTGASVESLNGERIDFGLNGGILWANGARVSDVDNLAANGVVMHALDNLLLPESIRERADASRAYLRVAHLLPEMSPVDLYLNGNVGGLNGLETGQISDWMEISAGDQLISIASSESSGMLADLSLTIEPESWITLAIVGENSGQQAKLIPLIEDYSPLSLGQARLSFFNSMEDSMGLDLLADGQLFAGGIAFPGVMGENDGFVILPLPVATYDFLATVSGNPDAVVLNIPDIRLRDGYNVFIAATGTPINSRMVILETNVNVMRSFAQEGQLP